jgi:hypothetical protein
VLFTNIPQKSEAIRKGFDGIHHFPSTNSQRRNLNPEKSMPRLPTVCLTPSIHMLEDRFNLSPFIPVSDDVIVDGRIITAESTIRTFNLADSFPQRHGVEQLYDSLSGGNTSAPTKESMILQNSIVGETITIHGTRTE